jgi:hypothetical protein
MKNKKYVLKKKSQEDPQLPRDPFERAVGPISPFTDIEDVWESRGIPRKMEDSLKETEDPLSTLLKQEAPSVEYTEEEIQEELDMYKQEMMDSVRNGRLPKELLDYEAFKFEQQVKDSLLGSTKTPGMSQEDVSEHVIRSFRNYLEGFPADIKAFGLEEEAKKFHKNFVDNLEQILETGKKTIARKK